MYNKLVSYKFSVDSGNPDIGDFLSFLDQILSGNNSSLTVQNNFYAVVTNFEKFINYANINEEWQEKQQGNILDINLKIKIKKTIQQMLIKGILQPDYINLIFEFHQRKPFLMSTQMIYIFLINSIIDIGPESEIDCERILSLYLLNAANYNNSDAIKILLERYNVSPVKTWPAVNLANNEIEAIIMPIIQLTNTKIHQIDKQFANNLVVQPESNFILMLNHIDFHQENIKTCKIQEIFRCAFKNKFITAIDSMLKKEEFCQKIFFTEEDLIMLAFGLVAIPDYAVLINRIVDGDNILKTTQLNKEDTLKKLNYYINILQKIVSTKYECEKFDHIVINIALEFISYFLEKNPENDLISNLLVLAQFEQNKLTQANNLLLETNSKLYTENLTLQKKLDKSNINYLYIKQQRLFELESFQHKIHSLNNELINSIITRESIEYKYKLLINENYRLQEILQRLPNNNFPSSSSSENQPTTNIILEFEFLKNPPNVQLSQCVSPQEPIFQHQAPKLSRRRHSFDL